MVMPVTFFDRQKLRYLFFFGLAVFLFGAATVNAASSDYGWLKLWASNTDTACGSSIAHQSSNPSQYTINTAVTVANDVFTIKRISDYAVLSTYSGTSQAGPGCFDPNNDFYTVDITGNSIMIGPAQNAALVWHLHHRIAAGVPLRHRRLAHGCRDQFADIEPGRGLSAKLSDKRTVDQCRSFNADPAGQLSGDG